MKSNARGNAAYLSTLEFELHRSGTGKIPFATAKRLELVRRDFLIKPVSV